MPTRAAGIRVFSKCRNEILRLPAFLAHYRALGVERFFIVDNGSTDGSTEYLAAQPGVELSRTAERFSDTKGGAAWMNDLLAKFGTGSWCVTVDVDELLVYPGSEVAALPALTAYLDAHGHTALGCTLLDLYPDGPLAECRYRSGRGSSRGGAVLRSRTLLARGDGGVSRRRDQGRHARARVLLRVAPWGSVLAAASSAAAPAGSVSDESAADPLDGRVRVRLRQPLRLAAAPGARDGRAAALQVPAGLSRPRRARVGAPRVLQRCIRVPGGTRASSRAIPA